MHGVLSLVVTFVAMAGVWIMLQAEFLALILVLVYVGAVMTLFLFVVMMINVDKVSFREGFVRYLPIALFVVLLVMGTVIFAVGSHRFGLDVVPAPLAAPADYSNIMDLGLVLYTNYVFPFEIAAVLLLTAIVASITLTYHKRNKNKRQDPAKQIAVDPKNRMRLVSMPSEKRSMNHDSAV